MPPMPEPSYAQYRRLKPGGVRGAARGAALTALAATAQLTGRMERELARPRVQFLLLHHVFADEVDGFRAMLTDLRRRHVLVSHSEAVRRIRESNIDQPCISIGFDDGFADNVRAAEILEEFGAVGCFFVCPGLVGISQPDKLQSLLWERFDFPVLTPFMSWEQIESLRARGHEIGGHTMTHPELSRLSPEQVRDEIGQTRQELHRRLGATDHFAWPKGGWNFFTPDARDAVFDAGFISCASGVRGCHVAPHSSDLRDLCIRRDHVFANWPMQHVNYLLSQSSRSSSPASNAWPAEYERVG